MQVALTAAVAALTASTSVPVVIPPSPPPLVAIKTMEERKPQYVCVQCNPNEQDTLAFLQSYGVQDRNALATIMGNIKQESSFIPNICEGGARVHYSACRSGGFGLIQWTSSSRYYGLGKFAVSSKGDPSSLPTQLSYLVTEPQWKSVVGHFKTPGHSIDSYMRSAYRWLGWGHHGARTRYAYDYAAKLLLI